jgi:CheY-like chemotaxis protein
VSKRKLLLADDSITIQKVVNLTFADEGIDVVTVGDGDAALAHLASETPDILLADVNMPGPTGYEICEKLRANEATHGVPVILLVGSFEPFDEAEATRVGANAYLTKPFQSIKQLIAQVNALMDASRPTEPQAAAGEPATVEPAPVIEEISPREEPVAAEFQQPQSAEPAPSSDPAPKVFDDLGYEVHAPATAVDTSTVPTADDIDSLYQQSVAGDDLSDVGIDDEMIETSYSAPEANDELSAYAPAPSPTSGYTETHAEIDPNPTEMPEPRTHEIAGQESASGAINAEAASTETESDFGFRSGYEQRFPDDPSKFENTIAYEDWKPADMREGENAVQTSSTTLGPLDTAPLNEIGPQPVEASPSSPPIGEDTIRMEGRFDTTGRSFKFDDVDLLDLSTSSPVEITSPANADEQGSSKQLVTLSPELIEMIAQRVVEKLSEKY